MSAAKASPFRWAPSFVPRPGVRKCGVLSFPNHAAGCLDAAGWARSFPPAMAEEALSFNKTFSCGS